jgi:hypothetical protein
VSKKTPTGGLREMTVRAPARLAELYENAGYRVRLVVERIDGKELTANDQRSALAAVAGYEADEHRPEVTAADVDVLEGLEELAKEEEASAKKPSRRSSPTKPRRSTR